MSKSLEVKYPLSLAANLRISPFKTNRSIVDLIKSVPEKLIVIKATKKKLVYSSNFPGIMSAAVTKQSVDKTKISQ
jgi:hypothetical protein